MAALELLAAGIFYFPFDIFRFFTIYCTKQAVVEDVFAKLSVETLKLPISVISDKHDKVSSIFQ